jgi:hypothetical protein
MLFDFIVPDNWYNGDQGTYYIYGATGYPENARNAGAKEAGHIVVTSLGLIFSNRLSFKIAEIIDKI